MASKADVEAGRAFVRLFLKNDMASQLGRALKAAGAKLKSFGRGSMIAGAQVAAAGTAILTPLMAAVKSFASQGDALDKMSQRTGMAADSLAELGFAAEQSGSDIGAVENAVLKMNRRLGRLTVGQGSATEVSAIEELGLSVKQLDSMNPEERFLALADAIAGYGDDAAAAGLAQRAFGTGVDRILPLLKQGREGIAALRDEARDLGIVPAQEEVENAAKVTDAINRVKRAVKAMFFNVGAGLAKPALQFLGVLKRIAVSAGKFAKNKGDLLATIAAIGAVLVAGGMALTTFGVALWSAGVALTALGSVVGVLLSPIGLITAAVVGATVAFFKWTESGQSAGRSLSSMLGKLLDRFREVFVGIKNALRSGNVALAFDIMKTAANLAFAEIAARATHVFRDLIPGLALAAFSGLAGAWGAAVGTWQGPIVALWDFYKVVAMAWFRFVGVAFQSTLQQWGDVFAALWKLYREAAKISLQTIGVGFKSQMQLALDITRALWEAFKGFGLAAAQTVVASFIKAFVIVPATLLKTLRLAFFQASEFLLKSLVGAVALWAKFTSRIAAGIATLITDALKGKATSVSDTLKGIGTGTSVAFSGMQALNDLQRDGIAAALKAQQTLTDAQLMGLTGKPGDFGKVATDFGADVATAVRADITRQATALRDAAKNQMAPAIKQFSDDMVQAVVDHAERLKAAGLDAAKVIIPAAKRLAEATKGMSEEVKAAFLERFQAAFAEIKDFKDPKAVTSLRDKLNALIVEAAETKGAAVGEAVAGGPPPGPMPGPMPAVAPQGVTLTATHSAAAARIAGYQPGGGGPEKKMVDGINKIALSARQIETNFERLLAGLVVN